MLTLRSLFGLTTLTVFVNNNVVSASFAKFLRSKRDDEDYDDDDDDDEEDSTVLFGDEVKAVEDKVGEEVEELTTEVEQKFEDAKARIEGERTADELENGGSLISQSANEAEERYKQLYVHAQGEHPKNRCGCFDGQKRVKSGRIPAFHKTQGDWMGNGEDVQILEMPHHLDGHDRAQDEVEMQEYGGKSPRDIGIKQGIESRRWLGNGNFDFLKLCMHRARHPGADGFPGDQPGCVKRGCGSQSYPGRMSRYLCDDSRRMFTINHATFSAILVFLLLSWIVRKGKEEYKLDVFKNKPWDTVLHYCLLLVLTLYFLFLPVFTCLAPCLVPVVCAPADYAFWFKETYAQDDGFGSAGEMNQGLGKWIGEDAWYSPLMCGWWSWGGSVYATYLLALNGKESIFEGLRCRNRDEDTLLTLEGGNFDTDKCWNGFRDKLKQIPAVGDKLADAFPSKFAGGQTMHNSKWFGIQSWIYSFYYYFNGKSRWSATAATVGLLDFLTIGCISRWDAEIWCCNLCSRKGMTNMANNLLQGEFVGKNRVGKRD